MLNSDELSLLCRRLELSSQAQTVLANIRSSPPSRRVGSGGRNVPVRYPSRKMGVIIQAESRTVEFAGVYLMEHDPAILEFWDQPPSITLHYSAKLKNGHTRNMGVLHTPDYFVIREDALGWEEWKTEEELRRFESDASNRYVRDEHRRWRCPPGEAVAAPLGFYYHVRSSAEIHEVFQRNLRFLSYYLREESSHVSDRAQEEVFALVKQEPGIALSTLLDHIQVTTSDDIYTLLAQDALYIDLYAAPLAEPERVHLFINEATARAWSVALVEHSVPSLSRPHTILIEPGAPVVWDSRRCTIVYQGQTTTTLLTEDQQPVELPNPYFQALIATGKLTGQSAPPAQESLSRQVRERMMQADKVALTEAHRRYTIIEPVIHGERLSDCSTPARTVRDWVAKYREAEQTLGCGYVGLLPKVQERGNRKPRLDEKAIEFLNTFIDKEYENHKQKNKREVYGEFENYCKNKGLTSVPSYKTFAAAVNRRPRYEQEKKRKGARAAYPREPMYWELSYDLPRHGDRPFEIVHIDHTLLDVELVDSQTRHHFGKPWATFLTDAFSRRLLAVYLTFDEPSYRSCMMILRECVHLYHRFPELVVVDWGHEFESIYFETLLARFECSKASRPKAKPRFGSVIERLFNTANTEFIHNLAGNTQVMKNVRQVTKSVNPREHAIWILGELYAQLRRWAYDVYDSTEHRTLGQTPNEAFGMGLLRSGARPKEWIEYDDDFIQFTYPSTRKGTAKLVPGRGVKINNIFYWAKRNVFVDHPELEKKQIPVRYDPYDVGHAYVYIKGYRQPIECISEHYAQFKGHSERELQIATEELRKRNQRHSQQFTVTAAKLAHFMTSVEAQEALLEQRKRDYEARSVFSLMEGHPQQEISASQRAPDAETKQRAMEVNVPARHPVSKPDEEADDDIYDDF